MGIQDYSTTAANNQTKGSVLWPEGQDANTVNDSARAMMVDTREQWNDAQWFVYGVGDEATTFTFIPGVNGTQFSVTGDHTAQYHVNRRCRAIGTLTGTIYGRISATTFGAGVTTVTVVWDSGQLQNDGDLEIALGILWFDSPAYVVDYNNLVNVPSTFAPSAHSHAIADVTGLQTALDGKAATSHGHAISDVSGLQTALDGKAAVSHTHDTGDVTTGTFALARIPVIDDTRHGTRGGGSLHAAATETARGFVELATTAEADAGSDTSRAVTPAGLEESRERLRGVGSSGSTNTTLGQANAGTHLRTTAGTAVQLTVSSGSGWSAGDVVVITQAGAGQVTLVGSGVTLRTPETLKTRKQWSTISLTFVSGAEAIVAGDLEAA